MPTFQLLESGMFDDVVTDGRGKVIGRKPLTLPVRLGQPKKWLFTVRGDPGSYTAAAEIGRPGSEPIRVSLGLFTLRVGEAKEFIVSDVFTDSPAPGPHTATLFIDGARVGHHELELASAPERLTTLPSRVTDTDGFDPGSA